MKTQVVYRGGMHFVGKSESGHDVHMDSGHFGTQTVAPTPIETVLQAAAVCSAMDVVTILNKRHKEIKRFDIEVEGKRREDSPRIFETMHIIYRVAGLGITLEEVQKAVQLSHDKYCSVINMLKPTVRVSFAVELLD